MTGFFTPPDELSIIMHYFLNDRNPEDAVKKIEAFKKYLDDVKFIQKENKNASKSD